METVKLSLFALIITIWIVTPGKSQEITADYVYGCENCTITAFRAMGKHKILFNYSNIDRRQLILLDSQNLVVDKIHVEAPMNPVPYGQNRIMVPDLNFSASLKIENNKFQLEKLAIFRADFHSKYGGYVLIQPGRGLWSIGSTTCGANKYVAQLFYIPLKQENLKAFVIKNPYEFYGAKGKEIPLFSLKNLMGDGEVNRELEQLILANKNCSEQIRAQPGALGFHSYDIDGNKLMVFLRDFQKLFYVEMDSIPRSMGSISLPLPEAGGWRHFYDLTQHLSYFLFEKKEESNSKRNKEPVEKTYKLYRLDGTQLTKVSEIDYLPVDIENNRLYELRSDKKAYHIYGHLLVPIKDDIQRIFITPE